MADRIPSPGQNGPVGSWVEPDLENQSGAERRELSSLAPEYLEPANTVTPGSQNASSKETPDLENQIQPAEVGNSAPAVVFAPGFTDRYDNVDIINKAKSLLGERNCHVTLKDVTLEGEVNISDREYRTVGSATLNLIKSLVCVKEKTERRTLLNRVTTAFAPGRLTLILGPPQSGKSSLLKFIASRLDPTLKAAAVGTTLFNNTLVKAGHVPRLAAYVSQYDEHNPVLTVEQTLNFAFDCMSSRFFIEMAAKHNLSRPPGKVVFRPKVEACLHTFGLKSCKDTSIGNEAVRGVSGGERRRVTSAEMVVGLTMVLCLDEISTGLDAAATSDITKSLKTTCHAFHTTTLVSLLQPPPEVINIFDDVLVLGKGGNLLYHGPVPEAEHYFTETLGFTRPSNVDVGDFLVDLCTDDARLYFHAGHEPPSCLEMAERWRRSDNYHRCIEPVFAAARAAEKSEHNDVGKEPYTWDFGASFGRLFLINLRRHLEIVRRDPLYARQRVISSVFQGVMLGWIFWQVSNDLLRINLLFMMVSMLSSGNIATIDITARKRAVFYKQRDANFYPTLAYTASETLSEWPIQILETVLLGSIIYFMTGFQASQFGVFIIALFLTIVMFVTMYKMLTAHTQTASAAQGAAMGIMALSFCFSGFLVTFSSIPPYFVWIYWIMPYSWILRLLALNEFKSAKYDSPVPCGTPAAIKAMVGASRRTPTAAQWNAAWAGGQFDATGACSCSGYSVVATDMQNSAVGSFGSFGWPSGYHHAACRLGDVYLNAFSFSLDPNYIVYGFIYLVVAAVLFLFLYYAGMEYRRLGAVRPTVVVKARSLMRCKVANAPREEVSEENEAAEQAFAALKSLSVQPPEVSLVLDTVSYSVRVAVNDAKGQPTKATDERFLLNQVSAVFLPGTMTALMGSSGAGKTTLMDVIAGRKTSGAITGRILVNGHPQDLATFSRISGYVEQNDIHIPSSTVLEALRFSALLRLPRELPDTEKERVVQAVVDLVELRPILGKAIGDPGSSSGGLSVEQRKRVTIAVEMVANPSVLFLDEPTSGLDSRSARIVMRAVRRIAATGRTVVCTIHQPSFEIFSMFDRLLLLKKGGWIVYCGDLGPPQMSAVTHEAFNTARNMTAYFESCSADAPRYTEGQNPAEYMLEVIGAGTKAGNAPAGGAGAGGVHFAECFKSSAMAREIREHIANAKAGDPIAFSTSFAAPYTKQYYLSTVRWLQIYWRNVAYNMTRITIIIVVAMLFSFNVFHKSVTGVSSLLTFNGALFAAVFFTSVIQATMTVSVIGNQKVIYNREVDSKTYSAGAYLFGLTLAEVPWILAVTLFHTVIYYPVAGLWPHAGTIVQYGVSLFLFATMFNYYGQMLAAIMPTTQRASLMCGLSIGIFNLYSGFFMSVSQIPWPWKILFYISPARFGLKAIMPPQFYCSRSCIADVVCNGPNATVCALSDPSCPAGATSLATAVGADGPGCGLVVDSSNQIALKQGDESGAQWLVAAGFGSQPTVTMWDYWSITTESSYEQRWSMVLGMMGFAVGFKLTTLYYLKYVKQITR